MLNLFVLHGCIHVGSVDSLRASRVWKAFQLAAGSYGNWGISLKVQVLIHFDNIIYAVKFSDA